MELDITDLISQIESVNLPDDDAQRGQLKKAVFGLQTRLESQQDMMIRLFSQPLEHSLIRIGIELGLFRYLANNSANAHNVKSLAKVSGASSSLLTRIFRFLSAAHIVDEVGAGQYCANKMTHTLADEMMEAVMIHSFEVNGPPVQCLPQFLAENKYQEITKSDSTPFQKAFNTDLTCFQWLTQFPKLFSSVQTVMSAFQGSDWAESFPTLDETVTTYIKSWSDGNHGQTNTPPRRLFVDVGGGQGHQCASLSEEYPALSKINGSMVVQDLPQAVRDVHIPGVEAMPHDFFTEQPVKGAHIYYMRAILHDWPDQSCIEILSHLVEAMAPNSMIMVDEVSLPATNAPWYAAMADLMMMISFGAKERGLQDWESIINAVGLRVKESRVYQAERAKAVMVLVKE